VTLNKDFKENKWAFNYDTALESLLSKLGLQTSISLPGFNPYLSKQPTFEEVNKETKVMIE